MTNSPRRCALVDDRSAHRPRRCRRRSSPSSTSHRLNLVEHRRHLRGVGDRPADVAVDRRIGVEQRAAREHARRRFRMRRREPRDQRRRDDLVARAADRRHARRQVQRQGLRRRSRGRSRAHGRGAHGRRSVPAGQTARGRRSASHRRASPRLRPAAVTRRSARRGSTIVRSGSILPDSGSKTLQCSMTTADSAASGPVAGDKPDDQPENEPGGEFHRLSLQQTSRRERTWEVHPDGLNRSGQPCVSYPRDPIHGLSRRRKPLYSLTLRTMRPARLASGLIAACGRGSPRRRLLPATHRMIQ